VHPDSQALVNTITDGVHLQASAFCGDRISGPTDPVLCLAGGRFPRRMVSRVGHDQDRARIRASAIPRLISA
jgi:hypothetical protein